MTDTTIKNWFLVSFDNDGTIAGQVLWGIVVEDRKSRWRENDFVCTSKVVEQFNENFFKTRNSEYECVGDGQQVILPLEALLDLRRGFSPDEYLTMQELQKQGFTPG